MRAYGSTEHPSITGSMFDDPAAKRHATDGRPMPGVEIRLRDDDGAPVPTGAPGEIWSRGPDLCLGYTDAELTARAFDVDGWYRTGDLGVLDADGFLTITDRINDVIIRGGENISAAEVEQVIAAMTEVAEVAVVAAPDARLGEHACAVVRLASGVPTLQLAEVTDALGRAGLARQKWPEELLVVDDFPRTATGKIRKVDLRARLRADDRARGSDCGRRRSPREDRHPGGARRAVELGVSHPGIARDLPVAGPAPQLEHHLVHLPQPRRADRLAVGDQPAVGVHGETAVDLERALGHQRLLLAVGAEAVLGEVDHLRAGVGVLQLDDVDVLGTDTGLLVRGA